MKPYSNDLTNNNGIGGNYFVKLDDIIYEVISSVGNDKAKELMIAYFNQHTSFSIRDNLANINLKFAEVALQAMVPKIETSMNKMMESIDDSYIYTLVDEVIRENLRTIVLNYLGFKTDWGRLELRTRESCAFASNIIEKRVGKFVEVAINNLSEEELIPEEKMRVKIASAISSHAREKTEYELSREIDKRIGIKYSDLLDKYIDNYVKQYFGEASSEEINSKVSS